MTRRWSARISDGNSSTTPLGAAGALAPGFRAASSATNGVAEAFLTITKPAGTVSNDVMVAMLTVQGDNNVVTPPAGWTEIRSDFHDAVLGANDVKSTLFWKRAGGAEPADFTFTTAGNSDMSGAITAHTNIVTAGDPVNANGGQTETAILDDNTIAAPSINASAGSLLIGYFDFGDGGKTFIPPPGMVERVDFDAGMNNVSFEVADQVFGAGGDTGARTATFSPAVQAVENGRGMIGQMVALTPAQAGGGDTFFGVAEDVLDYSGIRISAETDQFGFVDIESSVDGTNWRRTDEFPIVANERLVPGFNNRYRSEFVPIRTQFVRVNLRNMANAAQTFLRLQTILLPESDQPETRTPERNIMRTGIAAVPTNVFTNVTAFSQETFDKAVEILGYGATFNHGVAIGASFSYSMRLLLGGATVHQTIIRDQCGSWIPLRLETEGQTFSVQVLHNEVVDQSFRGFVQVREL